MRSSWVPRNLYKGKLNGRIGGLPKLAKLRQTLRGFGVLRLNDTPECTFSSLIISRCSSVVASLSFSRDYVVAVRIVLLVLSSRLVIRSFVCMDLS